MNIFFYTEIYAYVYFWNFLKRNWGNFDWSEFFLVFEGEIFSWPVLLAYILESSLFSLIYTHNKSSETLIFCHFNQNQSKVHFWVSGEKIRFFRGYDFNWPFPLEITLEPPTVRFSLFYAHNRQKLWNNLIFCHF